MKARAGTGRGPATGVRTVTLWTIQPAGILRQIRARREARVERKKLVSIPERYRWLVRELRRRVPHYGGALPWWFYCRKPDIRRHRHRWPRGERLVSLEVEVDAKRVVSFPSWAWNDVYGGRFLAHSAAEFRRWSTALRDAVPDEERWPLPPKWQRRLERSWTRLFDDLPDRPWAGHGRILGWSPEGREAVLETIRAEDVRVSTLFQGVSRNPVLLAFYRYKRRSLGRPV